MPGDNAYLRAIDMEVKMSIHRMRTIPEALTEIRAIDEGSAITPYCIRTLCKSGKVKCVFTGRKILVDLDDLFSYINSEIHEENEPKTVNCSPI